MRRGGLRTPFFPNKILDISNYNNDNVNTERNSAYIQGDNMISFLVQKTLREIRRQEQDIPKRILLAAKLSNSIPMTVGETLLLAEVLMNPEEMFLMPNHVEENMRTVICILNKDLDDIKLTGKVLHRRITAVINQTNLVLINAKNN